MSWDVEINIIPVFEITEVEVTNITTEDNTVVEVAGPGEFTVIQGDAWSASDQYLQNEIDAHLADVANPHATTLEQARNANNQLTGNIDANNNQINNLTNPSSAQQASTKSYTDAAQAAAEAYADGLVVGVFRPVGNHDASTGSYPASGTGSGTSGAIKRGDTYLISVAGTLGGYSYDVGDSIFALINTPGTSSANWGDFEHNTQQATESLRGTASIADATEAADENSTGDTKIITPKKLWANFWSRVLAVAWTWAAKQTFTSAPRFNSTTASHYLKTDASKDLTSVSAIPAADVSGSKTSSFISDFSTAVAALTPSVANATEAADENSSEDTKFITPKKLWANFWTRVLAVAWTWAAKQTFTTAPRFNSSTASQYLKTDASKDLTSVSAIPASDVSGTKTSSFISDFSAAVATLTPVKATSSEINAGTNDTKFATAAGLIASSYLDQSGSKVAATALGTNTYTASITPAITAYAASQTFQIKFSNANTGAATLNLNSLGAKAIKRNGTTDLLAGDIAAGQVLTLFYDGASFQPLSLADHYGTYSPTLTNTTNIAASTTAVASWYRVGNIVTVDGSVQIDPTATGGIALEISLPVASNFSAITNCNGVANEPTATQVGGIKANVTGTATLVSVALNNANKTWYYHFSYQVL